MTPSSGPVLEWLVDGPGKSADFDIGDVGRSNYARGCRTMEWRHPGATASRGLIRRWHGTMDSAERLLTPGEVALMFRVDPKTVTRWASAGRIGSIRTPGGHRRFRESEVSALLADLTVEASRTSA